MRQPEQPLFIMELLVLIMLYLGPESQSKKAHLKTTQGVMAQAVYGAPVTSPL